jgi:hypothetical protein
MLAILGLSAMMMVSCGDGSSSGSSSGSGKKLASNDFLGDLPNLNYQKYLTDSIISAEEKTEMGKLDWKNKNDWEKGDKLKKKFRDKRDEADTKYKAEVEKIKPQLIGKDVPFELEDGTGYKVNSFKITDNINGGGVYTELEVEVTDVKVADFTRANEIVVSWYEVDKEGNKMGNDGSAYIKLAEKTEGATGTYSLLIKCSPRYVNFAKIKFVKEK